MIDAFLTRGMKVMMAGHSLSCFLYNIQKTRQTKVSQSNIGRHIEARSSVVGMFVGPSRWVPGGNFLGGRQRSAFPTYK